MKRLFFASLLLLNAAPLFANDEGGGGTFIPDYQELVREGYGPRHLDRERDDREGDGYLRRAPFVSIPKPTQAFYANGYTIYYGYTAAIRNGDVNALYAFGYPVDYFRHMMPPSVTDTNLTNYAVAVDNPKSNGTLHRDEDLKPSKSHGEPVTTVQSVAPSTPAASGTSAAASGAREKAPAPVRRALPGH